MLKLVDVDSGTVHYFEKSDLTDQEEYEEDELAKLVYGRDVILLVQGSRNDVPVRGIVYREINSCKCTKKVARVCIYV